MILQLNSMDKTSDRDQKYKFILTTKKDKQIFQRGRANNMFPLVLGDCLNGLYCKPTARRGTTEALIELRKELIRSTSPTISGHPF